MTIAPDTHERLLAHARDLILLEGVEGFSMRKLASRAGVTAAAIYFHFADKGALLQAVMASGCAALRQAFNRAASVADPVERVRQTGLAFVRFSLENPADFRFLCLSAPAGISRDPADPGLGDPAQDAYAFLLHAVAEGVAAGRYRPEHSDPRVLTQLFASGLHGVAAFYATNGHDPSFGLAPPLVVAEAMCDALLRGLTVSPGQL